MPPTIGTNVLGRKVLYLPSFFTYGELFLLTWGNWVGDHFPATDRCQQRSKCWT